MNLIFRLFLLCLLILYINCEVIELQNGNVSGITGKSPNGREFHKFYGIPYAKPPVGELRFKNPVPADPWCDVLDASKPPPKCIQPTKFIGSDGNATGQEDCLYLNVFVPSELLKPSGSAPVIVSIHGGGFRIGTGMGYTPDYFMDQDVIFVSMNFRLGVLGYLGMNNDEISGNFGMKDQSLALSWVKENIDRFGGDPSKVTLLGQSSGSASIHLHMFSPLSKGLFGKAIMQAGSAFADWAFTSDKSAKATAAAFLVTSGCVRNDPAVVLKCLQRIPANDFVALEHQMHNSEAVPFNIFKPMIESEVKIQPFLTETPSNLTYQSVVPWITGVNSADGGIMIIIDKPSKVDEKTILKRFSFYLYENELEDKDTFIQKIMDRYFSNENMGLENITLKYVDIATDIDFLVPLVRSLRSVQGSQQQYVYLYDHRGSFKTQKVFNFPFDIGVCHSDEMPLIFRNEELEAKWTPEDKIVSQALVKFWTNFAISGDPNGESEEKLWKPMKTDDIEYLRIKSECVMETNYLKERFDFWQSLPVNSRFF